MNVPTQEGATYIVATTDNNKYNKGCILQLLPYCLLKYNTSVTIAITYTVACRFHHSQYQVNVVVVTIESIAPTTTMNNNNFKFEVLIVDQTTKIQQQQQTTLIQQTTT